MSVLALAGISGCSSGSTTRAGAIVVTDPTGAVSGQLTSLAVNKAAELSMTPENDAQGTGIDWSVLCGGSPLSGSTTGGACGTLSPAHTPDGAATVYTAPAQVPIGTIVTIAAAVTSDPSAISSVTLTITAPAIVLDFSPAPVSSLSANAAATFEVQLINDATGAGANWTIACGAASGLCGSFTPTHTVSGAQTTYTAPAAVPSGGTVTITATSAADSTRSVSVSLPILPAVQPIAVTLSSTTFTIGPRSTAEFIGTVANDPSNAGVTWTVVCAASSTTGNCGGVTPSTSSSGGVVVYKAPSTATGVNPITVTATATATESTGTPIASTATGTVTAAGTIDVSVTARSSSLLPLGNTVLTATVLNDPTNAGVTWGAACANGTAGACGVISNQAGSGGSYTATYTAPAVIPNGGMVTVSASPNAALNAPSSAPVPDNPGFTVVNIVTAPPTIAFLQTPPATLIANGQATVSAVVTNDVPPGGVTWTVRCGSTAAEACGYIQPYQTASAVNATYFAPPVPPSGTTSSLAGGQVAIVASSTADPDVSVVSPAPVTIAASTAISVRFVPYAPSQVQAGSSVALQAAVSNDPTNAGVDWQVCSSGCGFFTTTPAIPPIAATSTTPFVPAVPAVTSTAVNGWPNSLPIPYTAPAAAPSGGPATITALAHTDGTTSVVASVVVTSQATGPALNGVAFAGTQPVVGASVSLYVAGTSGYGSAATLLYSPQSTPVATTATDGSFTIAAGYTCPAATSQAYLVAAGGQVGPFGPNTNLTLMTALGPCAGLSSASVVLNEVTTVASAFPLARFAANASLTGNSSYLYLGSDSANVTGLANAFSGVNNLVDITTGKALFAVPAGNATVPYAVIDTVADILNTCTDSAGGVEGDGSPCGILFTATDPLGYDAQYSSTPPADTAQSAFNIAQHPATGGFLGYDLPGSPVNIGEFVALASPASPFQPVLNATPNDFSISLNYTGGGGLSGSSKARHFALDGPGNLWITDTAGDSVIEWNNEGVPMSPAAGFTAASLASPGPVTIDTSGDIWVCDSNGLTELNDLATEQQGSPFIGGGISGACQGLAFDGLGNLWVANSQSVSKFTSLGVPLSPSTGYTIATSPADATTVSLLVPIAIDDSNEVWVGVNGPGDLLYLAELNNGSGTPDYLNGPPNGSGPLSNYISVNSDSSQTQIAINAAGDVWVPSVNSGQPLTKVLPYEGPGTTDQTGAGFAGSGGQGTNPLTDARGVAIDGAGLVWVASTGALGGAAPLPAGLVEISSSNSTTYAYYVSASLANRALALAVDGSGNVWALLDNNTITEYMGLATPAVTPLALAVKTGKLGKEP